VGPGNCESGAELFDPSVRIVWLDALAAGESESVGLHDVSAVMRTWLRSWEAVTLTAERLIDAGNQVVVNAVWRGRGRASGISTEWRHGAVWTIRDGKVVSVTSYGDPAEALEAVGLRE
jgi:ketosteroid isomerase-like protein